MNFFDSFKRALGNTTQPSETQRNQAFVIPDHIGKLTWGIQNVSTVYLQFAQEDEESGKLLLQQGRFRHASYLFEQAMEKHVCAKIVEYVDPLSSEFRSKTSQHNLDVMLEYLIDSVVDVHDRKGTLTTKTKFQRDEELVRRNELMRLMRTQLQQTVIGNIKFGTLHNAMRYPIIRTNKYKNNSDDYTVSTFDRIDAEAMLEILTRLKNYIASIRVAESR